MVDRIDAVPVLSVSSVAAVPAQGGSALAAGGGSLLALPGGNVAAALRCIARTRRRETYELRIVNESPETVAAYTYAVPVPAGGRVWQGAIVPAFSSLAAVIEVPKGPRRFRAPLVAEINAGETRLTIGAPPLRAGNAGPALRLAGRSLAGFLLAALVAAGIPASRYIDAHRAGPANVVALALSRDPKTGAHARSHAQRAPAPRPRPTVTPLNVGALHVPGTAQSGESVRIFYRTAAATGSVALIDEFGRILARTELSPLGTSVLLVPNVDAAQDLDVVVAATRDSEHATASAPLFVRPAVHAAPDAHPSAAPALRGGRGSDQSQDGSVDVGAGSLTPIAVPAVQSAGQPIQVRVLAHPAELHLALVADGTTLAERDVPPGAQRITFPAIARARTLSLITTYRNGSGIESTIDPIVVR